MAISSAGLGSNIDVAGLVSQLMSLERRPLNLLNQRQSIFNTELSAYGRLKSSVSALQTAIGSLKDADDFKVFKATPADNTSYTATADSTAIAGNHSVTVLSLAKAQKLISGGIADTGTTQLGTGSLTISNGTDSFIVPITGSNNTLEGIANAVNSATDNFGVSATILNDGTNYRLVFSPNETGVANAITITVDDDDTDDNNLSGLSQLAFNGAAQNLTQSQAAADATLRVDGFPQDPDVISSASNTVTGVIQGVTLSLKAVGSSDLQVAVDTEALTGKANAFITAYNKLISDIDELHKKGGALESRNTVLTVQSQITSVFNTSISLAGNDYSYLAQIGISIQKDGKLALNASEFQAAVTGNLNDVVGLLSDDTQGFGQRLYTELGNLLQSDGVLDAATDGLTASIAEIDTRKDQLQARLDRVEIRLRTQFAALDSLLGSLQQTSAALARQLGQ